MTTQLLEFGWESDENCSQAPAAASSTVAAVKGGPKKKSLMDKAKERAERLQKAYEGVTFFANEIGMIADEARDDVATLSIKKPRAPPKKKGDAAPAPPPPTSPPVLVKMESTAASAAAAPGVGGARPIMAPILDYYALQRAKRARTT